MTAMLGTIKFVYVKSSLCQAVDLPGSNCDKNSRVVASDTRRPGFESCHQHLSERLLTMMLKRQKLRQRGREWTITSK